MSVARNGRGRQLPGLIDCSGIMGELGITRAAAEKIMRGLPLVTFPELRKVYVRRDDLARLIDTSTDLR